MSGAGEVFDVATAVGGTVVRDSTDPAIGSGASGGAATASAISSIIGAGRDPSSADAYATGGAGAGAYEAGETGGAGGIASGTTATATGNDRTFALVKQIGGAGGAGSNGGTGGAGGSSVLTNAVSGTGSGASYLHQYATGGAGGGSSTAMKGGAAGAATSSLTTSDYSDSKILLTNTMTGGAGGSGVVAAAGGAANASSVLTGANNVSGLDKSYGGAGGNSYGSMDGGTGGTGEVTATVISTTSYSYAGYGGAITRGGVGGNAKGASGTGGTGGAAIGANSTVTEATAIGGQAFSLARQTGGAGGRGYGAGQTGGAGGAATASGAEATGYSAKVEAVQYGGSGGQGTGGASGGAGASSILTNAVSGSTRGGYLYLAQRSGGGSGGLSDGEGGAGGSGTSSLTFDDGANAIAASSVSGKSYAFGGNGGAGASSGAGGDATASIMLSGAGAVSSIATAESGNGATEGTADANSAAVTASGALATASANATGSSGLATTSATTHGAGIVTTVSAVTTALYDGAVTTQSTASAGGTPESDGSAFDDFANATELPNAAFIAQILQQNGVIAEALGGTRAEIFGAGAQGAYNEGSSSGFEDNTSDTSYTVNTAGLHGDLILGLVNSDFYYGNGFESLTFTATVAGTKVLSESFTSVAAAEAYFTDNAVNLGQVSGSSETVDLHLDIKTASKGDGFGEEYILGTHGMVCYARGTGIATPAGEVPIEQLQPGDLVQTMRGETMVASEVRWVGRRIVDLAHHPRAAMARPIRIRHGAFAEGVPNADLLVSPDHAIFQDGMLLLARQLVNGRSIVQDLHQDSVEYFHIELDRHEILLANGLTAESYLDTGNRCFFKNGPGPVALHPEMVADPAHKSWQSDACAPLVTDAERVGLVWQHLEQRATALGLGDAVPTRPETTSDAAAMLEVDGCLLAPVAAFADELFFIVPAGTRQAFLVSRSASPAELDGGVVEDRRQLGLCVRQITVHAQVGRIPVPIDSDDRAEGWWSVERHEAMSWRWSDGRARLALPACATTSMLEIRLNATHRYPVGQSESRSRASASRVAS